MKKPKGYPVCHKNKILLFVVKPCIASIGKMHICYQPIQHNMTLLSWSDEDEWEEDDFISLDSADENGYSDYGIIEDRSTPEKLLSVWCQLLHSVQKSEIAGKSFAGIY